MDLWIRSQDKNNLLKVVNVKLDSRTLYANTKTDEWAVKIGFYKTKERALEVLDEIQKLIKPIFKINYEYDDSQPIIDGEWLKSLKAESKIEELSCYVYEMPKE